MKMKMKNLFFTILLLVLVCTRADAQYTRAQILETNSPPTLTTATGADTCFVRVDPASLEQKAAKSTTFNAPATGDNWFISIGGGIGDLMSEEYNLVSFSERVNPTFNLAFGKWISPTWGLRTRFTGAKLQGLATESGGQGVGFWYIGKKHPYSHNGYQQSITNSYLSAFDDPDKWAEIKKRFLEDKPVKHSGDADNAYIYHVPYLAGSFDLMLNINNFFTPYKADRVFETFIYGGIGIAHTFGDQNRNQTDINSIFGTAGVTLNFRLSKAASVFVDLQGMALPEYFDWKVGDGNTLDGIVNYTLGLTFDINRGFTRAPVYMPETVRQLNEYRAQPVAPLPVEGDKLYVAIYFQIDKHNVQASEMHKLDEIARFMRQNPDRKVAVSGYADVETAFPAYNQKLSERRANEVVRLLRDKYGIDSYRLSVRAFGDKVQPFKANEKNRVVIAFDANY